MDKEKEGIEIPKLEANNRSERKKQLKFFTKMLKDHEKTKPKVDVTTTDINILESQTFKVQAWASKYGILKRKIDELK